MKVEKDFSGKLKIDLDKSTQAFLQNATNIESSGENVAWFTQARNTNVAWFTQSQHTNVAWFTK